MTERESVLTVICLRLSECAIEPTLPFYLALPCFTLPQKKGVCLCRYHRESERKRILALCLSLLCLPFVVVLIGRPLDGLLIMDHHVTFVCVSFVHGKGFTKRHNKAKAKAKAKQKQREGKANSKSHDPLRTMVSIIVHTVPGSSFLLPSHTHPV